MFTVKYTVNPALANGSRPRFLISTKNLIKFSVCILTRELRIKNKTKEAAR